MNGTTIFYDAGCAFCTRWARTHGLVNGLGFSVCGLLGWKLERNSK